MSSTDTEGPLGQDALELLLLLADIYMQNGRPGKARVILSALEQLGQADNRARLQLALAQLHSGAPQEALSSLEHLAIDGELDAAFHLVRAHTLQALGHNAQANAAMRAYVAQRGATEKPSVTDSLVPAGSRSFPNQQPD